MRAMLGLALIAMAGGARAQTPTCDGVWHWVDVGGTQCLDGTQTGFEYVCFPNLGPNGPMVLFLQGGGACGFDNGASCYCQNGGPGVGCTNGTISSDHWDKSFSCDGYPFGACPLVEVGSSQDAAFPPIPGDLGQSAAFNGPTSPFNNVQPVDGAAGGANWNMVQIPQCTGDVYSGDATHVFSFTLPDGKPLVAHFRGYRNVGLDLGRMSSLFSPSEVALWGDSAGGMGAVCNLRRILGELPQTKFMFNNSGAPLRDQYEPLVNTFGVNIGAAAVIDGATVGLTCPLPPASQGWDAFKIAVYDAQAFPSVRKAYTDDYSDATINGFASLLGCTGSGPAGPSCSVEPANSMDDFSVSVKGDPTFKYFFHTGLCHAERDADQLISDPSCEYDVMSQGGVDFNDWVRGRLKVPAYKWEDVK